MYVCTDKPVFLQTALADVYNPVDPGLVLKVRLILDSDSQRSYISCGVKDELGLVHQNLQCLSLATFGGKSETKHLETTCVGMKMRHGADQKFNVLVVDRICEPISSQPVPISIKSCGLLSQLELADEGGESPSRVDVLIGVIITGI